MTLRDLAQMFARLEKAGGRLAAVRLVTELFARASPAELAPVTYLLQGQLRPPFEGVEFGVGERLLIRVIARAYEVSEAEVTRRSKRMGDLGLVAEALATATRRTRLTVQRAYAALVAVAGASGAGAVERKLRLLVTLVKQTAPLEGRYVVRIVQGRLRLGVGDATVIEAVAAGALDDRRKKSIVEHAYNVRSDLGGVVHLAYTRGEAALTRMAPRVGVPVRPALAQRLPSAAAIIARLGTVQAEPKYDGFRLQLHHDAARVWAFSRRLENVSTMFPELTAGVLRQVKARRVILEGEAVGYDPKTGRFLPFQVTMTRKRKHQIDEAAARHPLRLFAFDLLHANGRDFLPAPLRERHKRLAALVSGSQRGPVLVTEARETDSAALLQAYFDAMIRRGLEGIVAKRPESPYQAGARNYDWVKLKRAYEAKLRDTVDVVLIGYFAGRGNRAAIGIGSLLAAVYDSKGDRFRTVAKIGSGPSEEEWRRLRSALDQSASAKPPVKVDSLIVPDRWAEPRLVVEVLADEITRSPRHTCGKVGNGPGYALRFPRLLGVRTDKRAEDATTEQEILDLFRLQRSGAGVQE